MTMPEIQRIGNSPRWSDIVIHASVARWVEVANDLTADAASQVDQILQQIDDTLTQIGSDRTRLLQITIYVASKDVVPILNEHWDRWVPQGHAPVRACLQVGLGQNCLVEMLVTAAVP